MKKITFSLFITLLLFVLSGCQKTNTTTTEIKDGQYSKAEFTNNDINITTTSDGEVTSDNVDNVPVEQKSDNDTKKIAPPVAPATNYLEFNKPYISKTGLTVIVTNINKIENTGSYEYTISYRQENNTTDKELTPGTFKIFFEDGTGLNQYAMLNNLFPNKNLDGSYTFQFLKNQKPFCIEFNDDSDAGLSGSFFRNKPAGNTLKWKVE